MTMRRHTAARPHGVMIWTPKDGSKPREADTLQCIHCNRHFIVVPGSGTKRGFCVRCNQVTCGAPECDPCLHFEAKLEILEGTRNPTAVSVGYREPTKPPTGLILP